MKVNSKVNDATGGEPKDRQNCKDNLAMGHVLHSGHQVFSNPATCTRGVVGYYFDIFE